MFKKGEINNPNGRPKGSKDHKWSNLQYWFGLLEEELARNVHVKEFFASGKMYREFDRPAVDPNTRARLFLEGMKMIVSKMQNMPKDSDESVTNVNKLMTEMKQLEAEFGRTGEAKSDKGVLDNGKAPL